MLGGVGSPHVVPSGGTISINNAAMYTASQSVTLNLFCKLAGEMQIANGADPTAATWEAYATSKVWTLTSTAGSQTVSVRYRSIGGQNTPVYTATITLDTSYYGGAFLEQASHDIQDVVLDTLSGAEVVTWYKSDGTQVSVRLFISFDGTDREDGDGGRVQTDNRSAWGSTQNVPSPTLDDYFVTSSGKRYNIDRIEASGFGLFKVVCKRIYSEERSAAIRAK